MFSVMKCFYNCLLIDSSVFCNEMVFFYNCLLNKFETSRKLSTLSIMQREREIEREVDFVFVYAINKVNSCYG